MASRKYRVISRKSLDHFVESLAGTKEQRAVRATLDAWIREVKLAEWETSSDVKKSFSTASIITAQRVVFNVKGNSYRLITSIDYKHRIVFILWIGTHEEYDEIDAATVRYKPATSQNG